MAKRAASGRRKAARRSTLTALPEVPQSSFSRSQPAEVRRQQEAACAHVAARHGLPEPEKFGRVAVDLYFWIEADRYFATDGNFPSVSAKKLFMGLADRAIELQGALDLVSRRPGDAAGALVSAAQQVDRLNALPEGHGFPYQHKPMDTQHLRWELERLAQAARIAASNVKRSAAGTKGNPGVTDFLILLREEFIRQRGDHGSRLTKDPYTGAFGGAFFSLADDTFSALNLRMSNGAHYTDSALAAAIERALKKADRNRARGVSLIT